MFNHTTTRYGGIIGPDKGSKDYKLHVTGQLSDNFTTQIDGEIRQTQMESDEESTTVVMYAGDVDILFGL